MTESEILRSAAQILHRRASELRGRLPISEFAEPTTRMAVSMLQQGQECDVASGTLSFQAFAMETESATAGVTR